MNESVDSVTDSILNSPKYAPLGRATVLRIVTESFRRFGPKRSADEAKRQLHQMWGMYYSNFKVASTLDAVLQLHSSTKERLPFLKSFYDSIFTITGKPTAIVDFASGLNPLAYASLGYSFPQEYFASDIDQFTINTLNEWFQRLGLSGRFHAALSDLFIDDPVKADVALFLKVLPNLEQQQKGSSRIILAKQMARYIVVSYPTRSISGRNKGMESFYRQQFNNIIQNENWQKEELIFPNELIFIISKKIP